MAVYIQVEFQIQMLSRTLAQKHTGHEYLEIFTYLAVVVVDVQLKCDGLFIAVHLQCAIGDGVIDSVVDVKVLVIIFLYAVAANVGLICQNIVIVDVHSMTNALSHKVGLFDFGVKLAYNFNFEVTKK